MRAIVQRVKQASVTVDGELISAIKEGLCVLVGIAETDTKKDIDYVANKILKLKLFGEDGKRWRKSVMDLNYEVLCISQFTLICSLKKNKPDFHRAMDGERSKPFYEEFLAELGKIYQPEKIKDGKFAAYMQVEIQNDGPVTIHIDSPVSKNEASSTGEASTSKEKEEN